MGMSHKEIFVKVNALVDEGIAPLVSALSEFQGLTTYQSCQGGEDREAFVSFRIGETWEELGGFAKSLSVSLRDRVPDLPFTISLDWYCGGEEPIGYVRTRTELIKPLAVAIHEVSDKGL